MSQETGRLGKFLRKLRIDHDEYLRDMAGKLGVSVAFLSAVENGKKKMPSDWNRRIVQVYALTAGQVKEFTEVVAYDGDGVLDMRLGDMKIEDRKLSLTFARKLATMPPERKRQLQMLLFDEGEI